MFEVKNSYIVDFWFNKNITDCGKITDDNQLDIPVFISENEIEYLKKYDEHLFETSNTLIYNNLIDKIDDDKIDDKDNYNYNYKEKLNINYKINDSYRDNEYRKGKCRRNSKSNSSDISKRNTVYCHRIKTGRQVVSDNRMFDEKISHQHNKLFNQSNTNNDKGKMYNLPKTSRLHEYEKRERKILLDS
jgi:hypothetical protein